MKTVHHTHTSRGIRHKLSRWSMLQDGQRTYMKHWIAIAFSLLLQMYIAGETHAAQNFYYTDGTYTAGATTDVGSVLKQTNQGGSILENLLDLFGINYA